MIAKTDITDAIEACGLQWAEPDFSPKKPPPAPYACIRDTYSYDGSDEHVGMIGHSTTVLLYDNGGAAGAAARLALATELAKRNVKFSQYPGSYSYDLKLVVSEFDITEDYFEKWSDE